MEITKEKNIYKTYTVKLKEKNTELLMYTDEKDNFYITISDGIKLTKWFDDCRFLTIRETDEDAFSVVSGLYEELDKKELPHEGNGILWVSEEEEEDKDADRVILENYGDFYRFFFIRKNTEENKKHKSSRAMIVRFAKKGSKNEEVVNDFKIMYKQLEAIAEEKIKLSFEEQVKIFCKK